MCSFTLLSMKSFLGSNETHIYVPSLRKSKVSTKLKSEIQTRVPKISNSLIEQQAELAVERQAKGLTYHGRTDFNPSILEDAYRSCQQICADNAKVKYIGSLQLSKEKQRAIWALYAWGRRIDDLVDVPDADQSESTEMLERLEERLEDIFKGKPHDMLDTALADTVQRFSLDIQPFKELLKGMRMDIWKTRYDNFQELELYCYYVAGTAGLMIIPVLGASLESQGHIYKCAISLGIGTQLTNILRDVIEDAALGRIYLPQDDLREFGLTDNDIVSRNVTEEWCELMKKQIARARWYFKQADEGIAQMERASRWPACAVSMLYQRILDEIENNNYDNLTKKPHLGIVKKLAVLPLAYFKYMVLNRPL